MTPGTKRRLPFLVASLAVTIVGLAVVAMAACGGGGGQAGTSPEADASPVQAAPGTITVSVSPIAGQKGTVLLILAAPEGGGLLARACVSVTSDRFSLAATVMTDMPAGGESCGGSTPETVFPAGSYTLSAGIYVPPSQTAQVETRQTVRVSAEAPAEVAVDGASLSR